MAYYYLKEKRPITKSQKIAWFAGFFDGEGSVMIIRRGNHTQPLIAISSTDKFALEEAQKILEMSINKSGTILTKPKKIAGHKQAYTLRIHKIHLIYHFLRIFTPFMIIKKERATLLLEFVKSRLTNQGTFYRTKKKFNHLPYNERELFIVDEIKRLNNRGMFIASA